jgi:hypothetical protein
VNRKETIPREVLSDQLVNAIADRRVRAAVFTTFNFDPGFFEINILPLFFNQEFSQVDKVRLIQLEESLSSVNNMAVYYDRNAISQDAEPAHLDYARIDVNRITGCFHPKVILLLVDNEIKEDKDDGDSVVPFQSLIVVVQSANLTRAGWWENVECAHIEEIHDKKNHENAELYYTFRQDLLYLINRIQKETDPDEDHLALDQIHYFLRHQVSREHVRNVSKGGRYYTQLFCGQNNLSFSEWLIDLRLNKYNWNLEIISPFFDPTGAGPLEEIIAVLRPNETRVYLPQNNDGTALVTEQTFKAVSEGETVYWGKLPGELLQRSGGHVSENILPRSVHGKVYRLWNRQGNKNILIVGSVNLTSSAHSHSRAGNLEAAFLVDTSDDGYQNRWWIDRLDTDIERFIEKESSEDEGLEEVHINLTIRFDWADNQLEYRLLETEKSGFEVCETNGQLILSIKKPKLGSWVKCDEADSEQARKALLSSSFFFIKHEKGSWRVLVREENMGHRPSLLTELSPEEILEYWALLSADQRAAFIAFHIGIGEQFEGLSIVDRKDLKSRSTLFDRFAGIYHSFGCLKQYIETAVAENRLKEAETLLAGSRHNSLPSLLEKIYERRDGDPVVRYITFLTAKQLYETVKKRHKVLFSKSKKRMMRLQELLKKLPEIRKELQFPNIRKERKFLDWYEKHFIKDYENRKTI